MVTLFFVPTCFKRVNKSKTNVLVASLLALERSLIGNKVKGDPKDQGLRWSLAKDKSNGDGQGANSRSLSVPQRVPVMLPKAGLWPRQGLTLH